MSTTYVTPNQVKPKQKSIVGFFQKAPITAIPTAAEEPVLCKTPHAKAISNINNTTPSTMACDSIEKVKQPIIISSSAKKTLSKPAAKSKGKPPIAKKLDQNLMEVSTIVDNDDVGRVVNVNNFDKIKDNVINNEVHEIVVNEIIRVETDTFIIDTKISNDNPIIVEDNSGDGDDESNKDKSNNTLIKRESLKKRRSKKITANNDIEVNESDKIINNRSSKRQKAVKDVKDIKKKEEEEALLATIDAGGDVSDIDDIISEIYDNTNETNSTNATPTSKKRKFAKKVTIVTDVITSVLINNKKDKVDGNIFDKEEKEEEKKEEEEGEKKEEEEEAAATTDLITPTTPKATPKRKASKKAIEAKNDEAILLDHIAELGPEASLKLNISRDRIQALALELSAIEQCSDLNDINLDTYEAMDDLFNTAKTCYNVDEGKIVNKVVDITNDKMEVDSTITPSIDMTKAVISPVLSIDEIANEMMFLSIRHVLARAIQGSILPLSKLVQQVIQVLVNSAKRIRSSLIDELDYDNHPGIINTLNMIDNLSDPIILSEELKQLAVRESYGIRSKNASLFEDTDIQAIWRWEVFTLAYFTKSSQTIVKESRLMRKKYGHVIKSHSNCIVQLMKVPYDETKVNMFEERIAKSTTEVEKSKERRREIEFKKAADNETKLQKEEERKKQKNERDELINKKNLENALFQAEKKAIEDEKKRQKIELEQKAADLKAKQSNKLLSFFKATPVSIAVTNSLSNNNLISSLTSQSPKKISSALSAIPIKYINLTVNPDFDEEKFKASISSGMSMGDISRDYRNRYNNQKSNPKKKCRKPITIKVAVQNSSFGCEEYSELKEVHLDNKLRMRKFHEDLRPAYVGTFSKKSNIIKGRSPFNQDHALLNYDYDSEEEWEEELEGEDIGDSENDSDNDGNEGNELEYDEFFRRDNDFGSDADSDGEVMAAVAINKNKREGEEILGPSFLHLNPSNNQISGFRIKNGEDININKQEKDVVRLQSYTSVVFNLDASLEEIKPIDTKKEKIVKKVNDKKIMDKAILNVETKVENIVINDIILVDNNIQVIKEKKDKVVYIKGFDEELLPELIRFIHGKKDGIEKLQNLFQENHLNISKAQIKKRILEIAEKKDKNAGGCGKWLVKDEFINLYGSNIPIIALSPLKIKKRVALVSLGNSLTNKSPISNNDSVKELKIDLDLNIINNNITIPLISNIDNEMLIDNPVINSISNRMEVEESKNNEMSDNIDLYKNGDVK